MSGADILQIVLGLLQGLVSSSLFVLALFIGFCVIVGFTKTKRTAGGAAMVVKSLDERISHRPMEYLPPLDMLCWILGMAAAGWLATVPDPEAPARRRPAVRPQARG